MASLDPEFGSRPRMRGRTTNGSRRAAARFAAFLGSIFALTACGTTTDSLGSGTPEPRPAAFRPLRGPATYPNAFRDVLGKTDAEIAAKLESTFQSLFYGDPDTEAIYYPIGEDRAYIEDVFHEDVRTEGVGLAMMVAVQLDKRAEFDRLWTYAKSDLRYETRPARGYFRSWCAVASGWTSCADPYGHQQLLMSLLFARGRWKDAAPTIDYEGNARALYEVMRNKESENGGIVDGVTDLFDDLAKLPFHEPHVSSAGLTRPSVVLPAYYALWEQATGDRFWSEAATAGREYWKRASHPSTGLMPVRAYFDGTPVTGWSTFAPEAYRTHLNVGLDQIWFNPDPWEVEYANRITSFFASLSASGTSYELDGRVILEMNEGSLVVANGALAQSATVSQRRALIQAVWDQEIASGQARYFTGILDLVAQLILSGQFRVY